MWKEEIAAYNEQLFKRNFNYYTVKFKHYCANKLTYELEIASGVDYEELKRIANDWLTRANYKPIPDNVINPNWRISWSEFGVRNQYGVVWVQVQEYIEIETTRTSMR